MTKFTASPDCLIRSLSRKGTEVSLNVLVLIQRAIGK